MKIPSRRIALGIQYDGSKYEGWQSQPHGNTIQDHLERALQVFIGDSLQDSFVRVNVAGRTDTGVHALGQVVHFDVAIDRPDWSWVRGLNTYLPKDISVHWAKEVPQDFDARFSAQERAYAYHVIGAPYPLPLLNGKVGYLMVPPGKSLDIEAMKLGAQYLVGEYDFSSFRSSECQSKTPIKILYQIDIVQEYSGIYFLIRGNAFLHHMVRNLVGTLLMVGLGKKPPEWVNEILEQRNRQLAAPTFSPDGLYLVRVGYPDVFDIPEPQYGVSPLNPRVLKNAFGSGNWPIKVE
jgi:tRNA pseudouridine38-40 synthase